jgi:hypothetical protein
MIEDHEVEMDELVISRTTGVKRVGIEIPEETIEECSSLSPQYGSEPDEAPNEIFSVVPSYGIRMTCAVLSLLASIFILYASTDIVWTMILFVISLMPPMYFLIRRSLTTPSPILITDRFKFYNRPSFWTDMGREEIKTDMLKIQPFSSLITLLFASIACVFLFFFGMGLPNIPWRSGRVIAATASFLAYVVVRAVSVLCSAKIATSKCVECIFFILEPALAAGIGGPLLFYYHSTKIFLISLSNTILVSMAVAFEGLAFVRVVNVYDKSVMTFLALFMVVSFYLSQLSLIIYYGEGIGARYSDLWVIRESRLFLL